MWMLEGTWRGYRSEQDRVVHRDYLSESTKAGRNRLEWIRRNHCITFTDGTALLLDLREVPRRQLPKINGYGKLIDDCYYANVNSVAALVAKDNEAKKVTT